VTNGCLEPRHVKALELYALGLTRAEIGSQMNYSEITVKTYLRQARVILGARNSVHAVVICIARGILAVDARSERVYAPRPFDDVL